MGDYHTQTEHEWDVYVHLLPKGVLKIEYIVNDENVSEKKEIKGDWSLKNGELNLHFEKSSVRLILSSKKAKARGYLTPISWSGEQSYGLEGEPLYKGLKY